VRTQLAHRRPLQADVLEEAQALVHRVRLQLGHRPASQI
jgi:hypothetical protein